MTKPVDNFKRRERPSIGVSAVPSVANMDVFTVYREAPLPPAKCGACGRHRGYFEGCSMVECPERRLMTANVRDEK